ncbi:MAG TPA: hypothetical protein VIU85_06670 [Chthoniobacterales bacterium]
MKLPSSDVEFHEDIRLLIYRPGGVLNEASVNHVLSVLANLESELMEPFNRFTDTLEADAVDLNFRYVIHVALYRRLSYSGRPPVKSAILATDATAIHYAQLHAVMTRGSSINVRVFQDRQEAADWLEVPVERLAS